MDEIREQFGAVFLATGELKAGDADALRIETSSDGVKVDPKTGATSIPGVFAGGDVVRKRRLAVRAVADGKEAAESIRQYLAGERVVGPAKLFNSRMGKLDKEEMQLFLRSVSPKPRSTPVRPIDGFTRDEARAEALRCLRCDCGKADSCLLRRYAQAHDAHQNRYKAERGPFVQNTQHPDVVYEPGKCIDCGICIQIASSFGEKLGLAFVGRGFDVRVAVPFDESLAEGLKVAAAECVKACPTGALAFKG